MNFALRSVWPCLRAPALPVCADRDSMGVGIQRLEDPESQEGSSCPFNPPAHTPRTSARQPRPCSNRRRRQRQVTPVSALGRRSRRRRPPRQDPPSRYPSPRTPSARRPRAPTRLQRRKKSRSLQTLAAPSECTGRSPIWAPDRRCARFGVVMSRHVAVQTQRELLRRVRRNRHACIDQSSGVNASTPSTSDHIFSSRGEDEMGSMRGSFVPPVSRMAHRARPSRLPI